ncbi:hypothetical protein BGZ72_006552 [Mortierella alpina]|nr:hypothetical protein BGZ72_006552 [Mortierella alpina]
MRVKLTFEDPLPPYRCWYEIPASCSTVHDLQRVIRKGFELNKVCKTTRLDLDGFFLLPASSVAGSIKEGDLLQVMIRKKNDHLPPRSLPAVGGKRPREEEPAPAPLAKRRKKCRNQNRSKPTTQTSAKQQAGKQPNAGQQPNKNIGGNAGAPSNNQNAKNSGSKKNSSDAKEKTIDAKKSAQKQKSDQVIKKNNESKTTTPTTTSGQAKKGGELQAKAQTQKKGQEPEKVLKPSSKPTKQSSASKAVVPAVKVSGNISSDSSSDSSDSDSSDSDSSDSDSSDSSDSDSSSSSSDDGASTHESDTTELSADDDTSGASTKAPPGTGSLQTKLRNNRRKLQRKKEVLARMDEAFMDGKDVRSTPLDGSASKAGKQQPPPHASQHQKVVAPSPVIVKPSPPKTPKVVMTTVELEDKELMSKKRNPVPVQRVTRSSSKGRNMDPTKSTPASNTVKEVEETDVATVNGQKEDANDFDAPLRDYDGLPKLEASSLEIGDVMGYKTLELGADYNPIISDFKEAKVIKLFQGECAAEVQLARRFRTPVTLDEEGQPVLGKFDIYNEEEFERAKRGIVLLDLLSLADCRKIVKA